MAWIHAEPTHFFPLWTFQQCSAWDFLEIEPLKIWVSPRQNKLQKNLGFRDKLGGFSGSGPLAAILHPHLTLCPGQTRRLGACAHSSLDTGHLPFHNWIQSASSVTVTDPKFLFLHTVSNHLESVVFSKFCCLWTTKCKISKSKMVYPRPIGKIINGWLLTQDKNLSACVECKAGHVRFCFWQSQSLVSWSFHEHPCF